MPQRVPQYWPFRDRPAGPTASSLVSEIVLKTTAKIADSASITPTAFLNLISDVGDFITSIFLFKLDISPVSTIAVRVRAKTDKHVPVTTHAQHLTSVYQYAQCDSTPDSHILQPRRQTTHSATTDPASPYIYVREGVN